jgi:hypothetical protein
VDRFAAGAPECATRQDIDPIRKFFTAARYLLDQMAPAVTRDADNGVRARLTMR